MSESNNRINILLRRYLTNTCTREELEELLRAVEKEPDNSALRQALQQHWQYSEGASGIPQAAEKLQSILHGVPAAQPGSTIDATIPQQHRTWWRYAAAAVTLFAIAGAVYFYTASKRSPSPDLVQQIDDIAPGSNKAILTLDNGQIITLSDTGQQTLVAKGGTIIKQQQARLIYEAGQTAQSVRHTLSVPRGGQYRVTLPDGTTVWLNAASTLSYPTAFTGSQRVVTLQGEGYFEVAKNATQPFHVKVPSQETGKNELDIAVLGTHFNVSAYEEEKEAKTTLIEGAVKITKAGSEVILSPGQQARLDKTTGSLKVATADTSNILAWKNELFSFNNTDLPTVMAQLSRWYNIEISFQGPVPDKQINGTMSRNYNISQVLEMLEFTVGIHYTIENGKVILYTQP